MLYSMTGLQGPCFGGPRSALGGGRRREEGGREEHGPGEHGPYHLVVDIWWEQQARNFRMRQTGGRSRVWLGWWGGGHVFI